jgi:hypothetical protein
VINKTTCDEIFKDGSLEKYIKNNLFDPWRNTYFAGYVYLDPKQKGMFGENYIEKYLTLTDHVVKKPKNPGHDRIVDNIKTEFKFSLAAKTKSGKIEKDRFFINHVSKDKDWDRLIFFGINENIEESKFIYFDKNSFVEYVNSGGDGMFRLQQGGGKIGNDDYMCFNVTGLRTLSFVKDISEW